ncbi:fluoride efflux transporter CrcB [Pseudobacillus sp. 179-B 2D1 NHS]|uniref:fluoride efflux transporter CrcB n=1 Tax=Pseudobacillus sp. 179-B 2D1 NHS TaxID=3374292 RepID=UPI00387A7BE0
MIWLIGLGGALGAAARFFIGGILNKKSLFPIGTLLINLIGSFLLGWLAGLHSSSRISDELWFLGGVGFCGAYTTFSTFGYETITLAEAGRTKSAAVYVAVSVIGGCIAAAIGLIM